MISKIKVKLLNIDPPQEILCVLNTPAETLLERREDKDGLPFIAVLVNNDLCSLSYPLTVNCSVKFLTMVDSHGWRVYRRSLCFLLAKAVTELFPDAEFRVEHSFGPGLYCSFHKKKGGEEGITEDIVNQIEQYMKELVKRALPIERRKIAFMEAVAEFEKNQQIEKLNLLKYRNPPRIVVHWCDGFSDLAHGPLAPSTAVLDKFKLIYYPPGFVLHLPDRLNPFNLPPFEDQPHLFKIFREHKMWGHMLDVDTVGKLNQIIADGKFDEFVAIAETLHEKKITQIAEQILKERHRIKVILISGPSCAGKTTFAKRLCIHLKVEGIIPISISCDNYFVGADRYPLDESGNPDFEHIEALDLDLLNEHLNRLISGGEVEIPFYDFESKTRKFRGERLKLEESQILILEGIHCLNPRLTQVIPEELKFKIYVSALTQLNVDSHNRISTTDNRLLRRIVRDARFRGYTALETIRQWSSVRNGEKKWIFPFQRSANATFNSALDYELAVLKPKVEPLLMTIKPDVPEYAEARRLTEFLLNFLPASDRAVPRTSILREYIGGSLFHY